MKERPSPPPPGFEQALAAVGRGLVTAGRAVGRQSARAYRAIDPDLRRHLAQLPLLGYSLFGRRRDALDPGEPDGHRPLVFVHGLGGRPGDFTPMAAYLRWHGRRRSYRLGFAADAAIEEQARALAEYATDLLAVTGEPALDLVAHSLGGIVVRLAFADYGLAAVTRAAITLGTPHAGTYSARFADTPVARQLRPDSDLIRRLAGTPWPASVRGVSGWSRNDLLVLPAESAKLAGTRAVELSPFTHYSYLIDPRSWVAVRAELDRLDAEG